MGDGNTKWEHEIRMGNGNERWEMEYGKNCFAWLGLAYGVAYGVGCLGLPCFMLTIC